MIMEELQIWCKNNLFCNNGVRLNSAKLRDDREKWIAKYHRNVYNEIIRYTHFLDDYYDNIPTVQRVWHIINNNMEIYKCWNCGIPTRFISFSKGYSYFCSQSCSTGSKYTQDKMKSTNMKRFGVDNPFKNDHIKQLCIDRKKEKYGNGNNYDKIKESFIKNWGVDHPYKSNRFWMKNKNSRFGYKSYEFPSGKEAKLQGYEPYVLDMLLEDYDENEIIWERHKMPIIWYDWIDGHKHRYFPDFYVPKDNLIIEVKSTWTYSKEKEKCEAKRIRAKEMGFDYRMLVMSIKRHINKLPEIKMFGTKIL